MEIKFNKKEIDNVLADIHRIIGAPISLFDKDMQLVTSPSAMTEYCKLVRSQPCGKDACALSDQKGCKQCFHEKRSITYNCHAGLYETVTPIRFENFIIGYIMFGQYRTEHPLKPIAVYAEQLQLDENELLAYYQRLPVFTPEQVQAICNILESCILGFYLKESVSIITSTLSQKIHTYIEENIHKKITAKTLCEKFFINRKQLYAIFQRDFGRTVKEYLLHAQMEKAKKLLVSSSLPITEIAWQTGFCNYNNFIQRFKAMVGKTPLQYRKYLLSQQHT